MKLKYKILNKINLYSGFFSLNKYEFIHQKHDGEWTDKIQREVFSGAHVSTLLPYDPIKKEIVLIQQFRAGVISRYDDDYLYEIVAGIIEIVNDLFVQDNFESYNVQYILSGIILAFVGLLVHDSIRERVNDKVLPVEE